MDCCEAMYQVVCPKPRRFSPLGFHIHNGAKPKGNAELLGLIIREDELKAEQCINLSSSPPFFFGSPPCRTPNPVVQDARFQVETISIMCKDPTSSASQQSAHARGQLAKKQTAVRVEGFDAHAVAMT